ncbi:MAG: hypothetical protein BGO72_13490 [Burkholderiales bacterium 70-64]|nr:MAG: hypothetical protein BGO72_13490 [Burkholderiales bacterium 70-64]
MTEDDARNALLVRAFELAPADLANWSGDDRAWASRAAAEVEGASAPTDAFVARRARLAAERLAGRERAVARTLRALTWRPGAAWAIALAAFLLGAAGDAIGASQRINVLAPPLLALMAWNLAVYAALALGKAARLAGARRRTPGPLAQLLARITHAAGARLRAGADGPVLARFALDWARIGAALNAARVARVLHMAAIALALGALAGMYVRGLVLEYRASWQSTFLDAEAIRRLLDFVLGPAARLTGIALPDAQRLAAMRFPESAGEPAAAWIHLYAVTVALVIVIPRAVLALSDRLIERRLARRFPLALDDAYFSALARAHRGEPATVAVVPFAHALTPQAALTLRAVLAAALGPALDFAVAAPVAYGDEAAAATRLASLCATPPTLVLALLSSAATPEPQAHGAFVEALAAALAPGTAMLVVIDESAFLARFGGNDATAVRRRDERHLAWKRLLAEHERQALFVDLERADPAAAAAALRTALARPAAVTAAQAPR